MIEDMTVRNLSPATQQSYVYAVAKFGRHFNRSPDRLGLEDVPWAVTGPASTLRVWHRAPNAI
jgi:hypothetical protein